MTQQQMFDFVCEKFAEQGGPSVNEETCLYRSENGRKCAAGWFIPDEVYAPEFERQTVDQLPASVFFPALDLNFLMALQRVHDLSADVKESLVYLQEELRYLAISHKLDAKAVEKITKWEHSE